MEKLIYKKSLAIVFIVVFFIFTNDSGAQRPPREPRRNTSERKVEEMRPSDKTERWSPRTSKESFRNAAERKMVERNPPSRGGRNVGKVEKWSRGDLKRKFNEKADPNKKEGDKDGGKKDGTGNPPVAPPVPKPKFRPPGM